LLIVFGGLNYYGYGWLSQKQSQLELDYAELRADNTETEVALKQTDIATQHRNWIQAHEPTLGDEGDTKAQVLASLQKGARDNKLVVMEQSLQDSQHVSAGTQVNVSLKVKGPMDGLCHWLADLQKPESFYAISKFSLKADQDQKSMVCELQVARYFKGGS